MTVSVTWQETLDPAEITAVDVMLNRVSDADGVSSLSEHTYLHILAGGGPQESHAILRQGADIVGYGFLHDGTGELLIDPGHRGRGYGRRLLAALMERDPAIRIWAHGDLASAKALAEDGGLVPVRQLCRYTRALRDLPDAVIPPQFEVRAFREADAQDWLALNAEVFVDLPDQGGWTRVDLDKRLAMQWFDPAGFLLAFDEHGLAGFHWTKVHHGNLGEVYVLGVASRTRGTGLGMGLTCEGLRYLAARGLSEVMLYVDTSNTAAVSMYRRLGFQCADCDVQYAAGR